jgi:hypothetical protein
MLRRRAPADWRCERRSGGRLPGAGSDTTVCYSFSVGRGRERIGRRRRARLGSLATALTLVVVLAAPTAANAASKWSVRQLPAKVLEGGSKDEIPLYSVSCVGESLCVAGGAMDTLAATRSPTGGAGAWHVVYPLYPEPQPSCLEPGESATFCIQPRGSIDSVSCATEDFCVAVGYEGSVWVSTDPADGVWTVGDTGHGAPHLTAVSCPSASLCVAVSGGTGPLPGRIYTTTDPTSGVWQETRLGNPPDLRAVSCTGPSLCVAMAKAGRIFTSVNPTGGASSWSEVGSPTARDLEGVSCIATLCVAGDGGGNLLTSTDPTATPFTTTNADGSVQITGVSCPTTTSCVAVDNNADVLTSTAPTGGSSAWTFENLVPFEAESSDHGQFVKNALWGASCGTPSLCVLVGAAGRIFTSTEPFAKPAAPAGGGGPGGAAKQKRLRPRTHLVFAEHFWKGVGNRGHRHVKARFRFYSREGARGFQCKRDRGRWRFCHSPLRYWVGIGDHTLRVRAIGRTGLRGPVASLRFRVMREHRRH